MPVLAACGAGRRDGAPRRPAGGGAGHPSRLVYYGYRSGPGAGGASDCHRPPPFRPGPVCSTHSQASVLADIRAQDFEQRVSEIELRVGDLELIRTNELRDERDNRVSALESAAAAYEEWRP